MTGSIYDDPKLTYHFWDRLKWFKDVKDIIQVLLNSSTSLLLTACLEAAHQSKAGQRGRNPCEP
jgi:hypothetical protein